MTEFEGCYIFSLEESDELSHPPSKRRKFRTAAQHALHDEELPFVPLLRGKEKVESLKSRFEIFNAAWRPKEAILKRTVRDSQSVIAQELLSFIRTSDSADPIGKLRTGLIVAGPESSTYEVLFKSVAEAADLEERTIFIKLCSGQSPNLKAVLKHINQCGTSNLESDEDNIIDEFKDGRLLNYDLQILANYVQGHSIDKVLLSFLDSEAFEAGTLADLINVLSSWKDRIPFVLLFSIATSIELFQEKLPRETIRCLEGLDFSVKQLDVEELFKAFQCEQPTLWLGPDLSRSILQRQKEYIQSHFTFVNSLKYAYMTHFFANPLSILLGPSYLETLRQDEHYESVRSLPSFRRHVIIPPSHLENLMKDNDYRTVRTLLDNDDELDSFISVQCERSRKSLQAILDAIQVLSSMQSSLNNNFQVSWSDMYIRAMSADLAGSPPFEEIMTAVKRMRSDVMNHLLNDLAELPVNFEVAQAKVELNKLTDDLDDPEVPLRSAYDIHHETLRTTIVAQKVSLSKKSSSLSTKDIAYTKIVDRAYITLRDYLEATLINFQDLVLNEIFVFDSKSPHRDVFTPKPRFAIERALTSPHDYLSCNCCKGAEGYLSATLPPTAILYQLYLESGAIINTADLWSAFSTILCVDGSEDEEAEQQRALALFSRALAELKYMGMIRNSRKKADHIAKLSWKGL